MNLEEAKKQLERLKQEVERLELWIVKNQIKGSGR